VKGIHSAIIDIGSNTIRLVIYRYSKGEGLQEINNIKTVARLRTYLQPDGNLSEEGINVLKNALITYKKIMEDFNVEKVKAVATAAIRQARNKEDILLQMEEQTGIKVEVLSEYEEAYFGYLAVVHTMDLPAAITIDIGGGSTEITLFVNKKLHHTVSFPFGTVSLKQSFVSGEKINRKEKNRLSESLKNHFEKYSWMKDVRLPIVGIGGSARNLAHIHQHLTGYPISGIHQYEMDREAFNRLNCFLGKQTLDELKQVDGLSSDRADIIEIALVVFQSLMDIVNTDAFFVSKSGLREGLIIHSVMQANPEAFRIDQIFEEYANHFAHKCGRTAQEVDAMVRLTENFYLESCQWDLLQHRESHLQLLKKAARLFSIGDYFETDSSNQHTFYLIANQSVPGLLHKDRIKVALLASYKNKDYFRRLSKPFRSWFTRDELKTLQKFGALLKFVYSLNVSKKDVVKSIKMELEEDMLILYIFLKNRTAAEIYRAENQKKHIEKLFRKKVKLEFINEG